MSRSISMLAVAAMLLGAHAALAQEKDLDGAKDHPLLTRMPGYYITGYDTKDWDNVDASAYVSGPDAAWEGRATRITYEAKSGAKPVSMTQIARNYEAAIKKMAGKILSFDGRVVNGRLEKRGAKTWVQAAAFNDGAKYELLVVEGKAMEQEVVGDAAALRAGLAAEGRVAVYGILFDTNKAVVKPESEPALAQITKLLADDAKLRLFVVGHTDGTGALDANLKLSSARAGAIVAALVSRGVVASRLVAVGMGPYAPVATNRTDEGRAKNRRVELVDRL